MPDKPENSAFKLLSSRKTLVMATADKNGTPNVSLSPAFAAPAAYGDLVATILQSLPHSASPRTPPGRLALSGYSTYGVCGAARTNSCSA